MQKKDKLIFGIVLAFVLCSIILKFIVIAFEPHGIQGYVFMSNGVTQAPSGLPVTINNTNTSDFIRTQTFGPPIAPGFYSATINGSDNDTIIVRAWNATYYGQTSALLLNISLSPATHVNVTLNLTRPSETNVTITDPPDRAVKNLNRAFYITVNITIIGGQNGTNCNATLSIVNASVFVFGAEETPKHILGNISLTSSVISLWNITSVAEGKSDFIVVAACGSDGLNFDNATTDRVYNITALYIPTPEPHGVSGYVFMANGITQAPSGTNVSINDTFTGDFVYTRTYGPPIAPGFYSATINGTTADTIIVTAWNRTHYGRNTAILLDISESPATYVNVTLNATRPSETNVSILMPFDFAAYLVNHSFFVNASVMIIGGQNGTNCNATISFSNASIVQLGSGESATHLLGNMALGSSTTTQWNLSGTAEGRSNITVRAWCGSDGMNFDGLDRDTVINITFIVNRAPVLSNLVCENPIVLTPGTTKQITCNVTIHDADNLTDIVNINSSFYDVSSWYNGPDDNNNHYTNNNCFIDSSNETTGNYSCIFPAWYYANNATWIFNVSVRDSLNNSADSAAFTLINEMYAINVSPIILDFGELEPLNTSPSDVEASLNNYGNRPINVTLEGFGLFSNDNLSMICSLGSVPISYERYSLQGNTSFTSMINMSSNATSIANFTLYQRTNDVTLGNDTNSTYWKLYLPPAVAGLCNGTIIFTAIPT
jgi:hypothetical protein